ncbi:GDP/GTP exchange factor for ARF [Gaertneriomyces sp. JEL0708]|nr:GDP/GTP exchange factor for ARF [Gaertneriomyces sp. JEL0708]
MSRGEQTLSPLNPNFVGTTTAPELTLMTTRGSELPWQHIVHSEIVSVTSIMRRNQRWRIAAERERRKSVPLEYELCQDVAARGRLHLEGILTFMKELSTMDVAIEEEEMPLLQGFAKLKTKLMYAEDIADISPMALLEPFLEVIRSGETTGAITGAALSSVEKFITYRLLDLSHPDLAAAVYTITHSVTRCKFEATDSVQDEAVLAKILQLLRVIITSEIGHRCLDDKGICEMVEVAFGMFFQGRVSELLRRSAERTLLILTQALFQRLSVVTHQKENASTPHEPTGTADYTTNTEAPVTQNTTLPAAAHIRRASRPNSELEHSPSITVFREEKDTRQISVAASQETNEGAGDQGPRIAYAGNDLIVPDGGLKVVRQRQEDSGSPAIAHATPSHQSDHPSSHVSQSPLVEPVTPSADPNVSISDPKRSEFRPFGLPATVELLRVLITLIDPRSKQHTDSMHRSIALRLLHTGLEVGGRSLGRLIQWAYDAEKASASAHTTALNGGATSQQPPEGTNNVDVEDDKKFAFLARDMIVDDLCKHLFQLLQHAPLTTVSPPSATTLTVFALSVKCVTSLFKSARSHLKLQQEWFMLWAMARLNAGLATWELEGWAKKSGTPELSRERDTMKQVDRGGVLVSEARELLLEALLLLCGEPGFIAELYVNYDGDMDRQSHLFEELFHFCARSSFPDVTPGGPITTLTHQSLSFDAILRMLKEMVDNTRTDRPYTSSTSVGPPSSYTGANAGVVPAPEAIRFNKTRKRLLKAGAECFNSTPKDGIKYLQEHDFLPDPVDSVSLARLLKTTASIDKTLLGTYLASPKHVDLLKSFISLYDFSNKRLDEALRLLIESFRLPGESQQIERIMEVFAHAYFDSLQAQGEERELATFDACFILSYSIIMLNTDQHNPQVRHRMTIEDFMRNLRGVNGGKDFRAEYLNEIYEAIRDNEIVMPEEHKGDLGFNYQWRELMKKTYDCGILVPCRTSQYDKDMFILVSDAILVALSYALENAETPLHLQKSIVAAQHYAFVAAHHHLSDIFDNLISSLARTTGLLKEGRPVKDNAFDPWKAEFGRNVRGQIVCVVMFSLVSEWGNALRSGWYPVVKCLRNLFLHAVVPSPLLVHEDFLHGQVPIPRLEKKQQRRPMSAGTRREAGLFGALSNFLSLGFGDELEGYEPSAQELQWEKRAEACARACKVDGIAGVSRFLEKDALNQLIGAIIQASSRTLSQAEQRGTATPEASSDVVLPEQTREFDTAAAFLLDMLVNIAIQNRDRISCVWDQISLHIESILNSEDDEHVQLVQTAVSGLVRIATRVGHNTTVVSSILTLVSKTRPRPPILVHLCAGLLYMVQSDTTVLTEGIEWNVLLPLLVQAQEQEDAARYAVEAVGRLCDSRVVSAYNWGDWVDCLGGFVDGSPERAGRALEWLFMMHARIPTVAEATGMKLKMVFFTLQLPLLSTFTGFLSHAIRDVRHRSLSFLQRALLSHDLTRQEHLRGEVFENVVFPVLDAVRGDEEMQSRGVAVGCKVWLSWLPPTLPEHGGKDEAELSEIWIRLLRGVASLGVGGTDGLYEGVVESLKNVLLVMSAQGMLRDSSDWKATWETVEAFAPGLRKEIEAGPSFETGGLSDDSPSRENLNARPSEVNVLDLEQVGKPNQEEVQELHEKPGDRLQVASVPSEILVATPDNIAFSETNGTDTGDDSLSASSATDALATVAAQALALVGEQLKRSDPNEATLG